VKGRRREGREANGWSEGELGERREEGGKEGKRRKVGKAN
jgi:hypothetical protein